MARGANAPTLLNEALHMYIRMYVRTYSQPGTHVHIRMWYIYSICDSLLYKCSRLP